MALLAEGDSTDAPGLQTWSLLTRKL